jgi:hypothetical protein
MLAMNFFPSVNIMFGLCVVFGYYDHWFSSLMSVMCLEILLATASNTVWKREILKGEK